MLSAVRNAIAPLYLLACLILGGSDQGIWSNALLQLAGIAIIAWAAMRPLKEPLKKAAINPMLLMIAALLIVIIQTVPLPPHLWAHGIRARIYGDDHMLAMGVPWRPISLAPYDSLTSLFTLIPPIAVFVGIVGLKAYRASWLAGVLLLGAFAGILLGVLQLSSVGPNSPWYLYTHSSFGAAPGFFANRDHMATLLLITLPFLAALAATAAQANPQRYFGLLALFGALGLLVIAAIAVNRSLAGYLLLLPVLVASSILLLRHSKRSRHLLLMLGVLSLVAAVAGLEATSIGSSNIGQHATTSVHSRLFILRTTGKAIADFMPFGSGLGSFPKVYHLYEGLDVDPTAVIVHAHNDYAELALDLGLPGIVLILLFLWWWIKSASAAWKTGGTVYGRAASIASATILVHSLVDFPLRTAAISACFAMCLGLLLSRRPAGVRQARELRPARHLVFE